MTVGVATMAESGLIVFAADRMLTRGATESEPPYPKIFQMQGPFPLTVTWSGSVAIFSEVKDLWVNATNAAKTQPTTVGECVDAYCNAFCRLIAKRAERAILAPLDLTPQALVTNKVSNDKARLLIELMTSYSLSDEESVHVIIAGHDARGPHIFTAYNQSPSCHDDEGCAAVGVGAEHAYSQLSFAGYSRKASPTAAIVLAHFAKRRAEIAPGVGRVTDVGVRMPEEGYEPLSDELIGLLDAEYARFAHAEMLSLSKSVSAAMRALVGHLFTQRPSHPDPTAPQSPPESTHGP